MLTAIVGINWGDEGKGRMVDLLSEHQDIVVRYQGGNNAGILCCWYDPEDRPLPQGLTVHYHIQDLNQVREILTLSL